MYGYRKSNDYAPSAEKLFVDIKDIIEQTFPELHQDIINDALHYGRIAYEEYLSTGASERDSEQEDQQSKEIFLRSVMERILEHNRREHETLMTLMLAQQRHFQSPLTSHSDLSSGLLTLNSHQQDKIFEKNRNRFTQQSLKFPYPGSNTFGYRVIIPEILRNNPTRMEHFRSLSDKLQRQLARIDSTLQLYVVNVPTDVRENLLVQIFDEMYMLTQLNLNANQLERLLINSVSQIIRASSLNYEQKRSFIHYFTHTINNQENIRYSHTVKDSFS